MLKPTIRLRSSNHALFINYFKSWAFFILILMLSCSDHDLPKEISPVSNFELTKYLGTWHEIARYKDHWFEKDLEEVTATYTKNKDGSVKVTNAGTTKKGKRETKIGIAKFVGGPTIGHLKVSFFRPFYGNYVILYLEPDYSVALVTSDKKEKYCWILSRTPILSAEQLDKYIQILKGKGFPTDKLIFPKPYQGSNKPKSSLK